MRRATFAAILLFTVVLATYACAGVGPNEVLVQADGGEEMEDLASPDAGAMARVHCDEIWQRPDQGSGFYESNPSYIDEADTTASFAFSLPEEEGMDSASLTAAANELAALPYLTSFLVLRHDAIVFEQYFHGSDMHQSNNVHSASKSILAAVVGIAVQGGYLSEEDTIAQHLPAEFAKITDTAKRAITVKQLLTMTAGYDWQENSSESEIESQSNWVQAIVDLPLSSTPGSTFNYSTSQSHLLSAIIGNATGMNLCEFAHAKLLGPLGITAEHWGRDPQGNFSGGYNLYLTPRELAKFGLLTLHQGRWDGEQLVPESWMRESTQWHQDTGGDWGYGYQWWVTEMAGHSVQVAWGWGGQLVYVIPSLDLVVVMTTNTKDFSVDFDGAALVESQVIPAAT